MTRKGHESMDIEISPRGFMDLCVAENDRRLAGYDSRLLRPRLVPGLVRGFRRFLGRT